MASRAAGAIDIDPAKVVDLTYGFEPDDLLADGEALLARGSVQRGETPGGYWYEANNFCAAEHGGTHMDAPAHFAKGGASADQVPVTAGIGPLVRVDVSAAGGADADYRLAVADLDAWEAAHGRIPSGAIVVMYSGWGARWPDAKRYLGTDVAGDVANLHFPGFSQGGGGVPGARARHQRHRRRHGRASTTARRPTSSSTRSSTAPASRGSRTSPTSTACRRPARR